MRLIELRNNFPWQLQVTAKIGVEQLNLSYSFLKLMGLTLYGGMERPQYAYDTFMKHFKSAPKDSKNYTILELGPGDSVSSAIIAHTLGVSKTYLVDAGSFAEHNTACYNRLIEFLGKKGLDASDMVECKSLHDYLERSNCEYLTSGLDSLKSIPDSSVDFIWSHAVLEHIRKKEFLQTFVELRRILKPTGVSSHLMDLQDHMNGNLNHLRLSQHTWNSYMFRTSNFTNRISFPEALGYFKRAGFNSKILQLRRWSKLPVPKKKMAKEFQALTDDDLRILDFHVLLYPV
ncbi:MAG: hypothetical protein QG646_1109 [Euryarchaeota archaeon]|nr:hypothetical protein [Euryarchaeota archaeon]